MTQKQINAATAAVSWALLSGHKAKKTLEGVAWGQDPLMPVDWGKVLEEVKHTACKWLNACDALEELVKENEK